MKDDTISRQDAIDAVKHAWAKGLEPSQYIEELPSAQAERKTGRWEEQEEYFVKCSECHTLCDYDYKFCPNCGAKMVAFVFAKDIDVPDKNVGKMDGENDETD